MRFGFNAPKMEWFKAESAAAAAALVSILGITFGWPAEVQVGVVTLLVYAAGYVTIKE